MCVNLLEWSCVPIFFYGGSGVCTRCKQSNPKVLNAAGGHIRESHGMWWHRQSEIIADFIGLRVARHSSYWLLMSTLEGCRSNSRCASSPKEATTTWQQGLQGHGRPNSIAACPITPYRRTFYVSLTLVHGSSRAECVFP